MLYKPSHCRKATISRVPFVSKQEQDKAKKAVAEEIRPIGDLEEQNVGGLPNEFEIALANINNKQQATKNNKAPQQHGKVQKAEQNKGSAKRHTGKKRAAAN